MDAALAVLTELAGDTEPAVAAAAWKVLTDLKIATVLPLAEKSLGHADPRVRRLCIAALAAHPTPDRLRMLADRLDDLHPGNRAAAREAIISLSNDANFREPARELTLKAL